MSDSTFPGLNPVNFNERLEQSGNGLILPPPPSNAQAVSIEASSEFQCINIGAPFDLSAVERLLDERDRASWRDIVNLYPGRY